MLNKTQLNQIGKWVKQNARAIESAKWDYIFNNGSKERIVSELLKYQNPDGGFGNGLEADILLPQSNAITSAEAIFTAYEYGLDCTQNWFAQLMGYFENSIRDIPSFWEPVPKGIDGYPRPPWWNYYMPESFSPNPCAIIASALFAYGTDKQREIGLRVAQKCVYFILSPKECDDHEGYCLIALIDVLRSIGSPLITDDIISTMKRKISNTVCYDESKWGEYHAQPLDFAHSPQSIWYDCVKDGIESNFNYWINSLNSDGVWIPNFSWGIDSDSARQATKNWTGFISVRRAKIMNNYNMLEG